MVADKAMGIWDHCRRFILGFISAIRLFHGVSQSGFAVGVFLVTELLPTPAYMFTDRILAIPFGLLVGAVY
jgi:hypothetical protein